MKSEAIWNDMEAHGNKGYNIENIWQSIWGKIKEQIGKTGRNFWGSKTPKPQKSSSSATLSPSPKKDKNWASSTQMGSAAHLSEKYFPNCVQHLIFALANAMGNIVGTVWSLGWEVHIQRFAWVYRLFNLLRKYHCEDCTHSLIGFSDDELLLNHRHHMFWDSFRLNLRPHSCGPSSLSLSNIVENGPWVAGRFISISGNN
jgi:hypothetical protein